MNRLTLYFLCLILCLVSLPVLQAAEGDDALTGLLRGTYGVHGHFVCLEAKQNEQGTFPPLPHFELQSDGTSKLLVEAETTTYQIVGTWEFDGNGNWVAVEVQPLIVVHQRVSPGDTALQPLNPLSCEGTYSVDSGRKIQGQGTCQLPLEGVFPLTLNAGPFIYSGYLGVNPQFVLLADVTPQVGVAEIKSSSGSVVASYEGYCTQSLTMVKIDSEPIHFAQFGNGGGLVSDIVLTNPGSVAVGGSVRFTDDNGAPFAVGLKGGGDPQSSVDFALAPLGSTTISTDGQGAATPGSARVEADQDLGGVIRFTIPGIGVAGVGRSEPLSGFIAPVRRKAGGISTGLALENVEEHPVTIRLQLRNESGEVLGERSFEEFAARGHVSQFIEQIFPGVNTEDFQGVVTVHVEGGRVAATAIELDALTNKFTTLPVTALN